MKLTRELVEIFRKDWKPFVAVNVFYFGLVIVGALIALIYPGAQESLLKLVTQGYSTGSLSMLGEAYTSGAVLYAAAVTFMVNFFIGTLAYITIPSLVFAPWAVLTGAIRALMWGIMLIVPHGDLTLARLAPHYITLLIEGEGYVVAIFACTRQIEALIWPGRLGEQSRLKAYLRAIVDNVKLLLVVAALLALSALYEAWEVMFFAGII